MSPRILEYHPEDMTVTAEAGLLLSDLQKALNQGGQWLPIDPPFPERTTIAELISRNLSGPRRHAFGTVREHLLGLTVRLFDGRIVKSGGKVVKNVAGYDLHKLFVGAGGTLGTILQTTFKVRPLPEKEVILSAPWDALDKVLDSELMPVLLDLTSPRLVIGFAGSREEVDWQVALAQSLGITEPGNLDYERDFWQRVPDAQKVSVLPTRLLETIGGLGADLFVARAGAGVIYYQGGKAPPTRTILGLEKRLRSVFNPAEK